MHRAVLEKLGSRRNQLILGGGLTVVLSLGLLAVIFVQGSAFTWNPEYAFDNCEASNFDTSYTADCSGRSSGYVIDAGSERVLSASADSDGNPTAYRYGTVSMSSATGEQDAWYINWYADYLQQVHGVDKDVWTFNCANIGSNQLMCTDSEEAYETAVEEIDEGLNDISDDSRLQDRTSYSYGFEMDRSTIFQPIEENIEQGTCSGEVTFEAHSGPRQGLFGEKLEGDTKSGGTGVQCVIPSVSDGSNIQYEDLDMALEIDMEFSVEKWVHSDNECVVEEFPADNVPNTVYDSESECVDANSNDDSSGEDDLDSGDDSGDRENSDETGQSVLQKLSDFFGGLWQVLTFQG